MAVERVREAELQRSRTRWSAERRGGGGSHRGHRPLLQRSRTRWSAESDLGAAGELGGDAASTEPHSLECGEIINWEDLTPVQACFNGAALVGVRRA